MKRYHTITKKEAVKQKVAKAIQQETTNKSIKEIRRQMKVRDKLFTDKLETGLNGIAHDDDIKYNDIV